MDGDRRGTSGAGRRVAAKARKLGEEKERDSRDSEKVVPGMNW
jgi:hypothetical protein